MMIIDLVRALQAGKELSNAKAWKRTQFWTSNMVILLGAGVSIAAAMGYPIPITPDQITTIVSAAAVLIGVFNSYTTVATTAKLGVQSSTNTIDAGTANSSGYSGNEGSGIQNLDDRTSDKVPVLENSEEAGLWFKELDDRGFDSTK